MRRFISVLAVMVLMAAMMAVMAMPAFATNLATLNLGDAHRYPSDTDSLNLNGNLNGSLNASLPSTITR